MRGVVAAKARDPAFAAVPATPQRHARARWARSFPSFRSPQDERLDVLRTPALAMPDDPGIEPDVRARLGPVVDAKVLPGGNPNMSRIVLLALSMATQAACVTPMDAAGFAVTADAIDTTTRGPPSKWEREDCDAILVAPQTEVPGCAECGTEGGEGDPRRAACRQMFKRWEAWKRLVREANEENSRTGQSADAKP